MKQKRKPRYKRNLASGPVDEALAHDVALYVLNDADLYRQMYEPIIKNLVKKWRKGVYDPKKAAKLWGYLIKEGAKKYVNEFFYAEGGHARPINKATRDAAAKIVESEARDEVKENASRKNAPRFYQGPYGAAHLLNYYVVVRKKNGESKVVSDMDIPRYRNKKYCMHGPFMSHKQAVKWMEHEQQQKRDLRTVYCQDIV